MDWRSHPPVLRPWSEDGKKGTQRLSSEVASRLRLTSTADALKVLISRSQIQLGSGSGPLLSLGDLKQGLSSKKCVWFGVSWG